METKRLFSKLDVQICADCLLIVKSLLVFGISCGVSLSDLDSPDVRTCYVSVFIVKVLYEAGILSQFVNFHLDSLSRVYEFLSGRSLESDFCFYNSLNHGN